MVIIYSQDYGPDVGRPSSKKPPRLYCLGFVGWESHFEIRTLLLVASSKKPPMINNDQNFLIFCSNCSFSKFSFFCYKNKRQFEFMLSFKIIFGFKNEHEMFDAHPTYKKTGRSQLHRL